MPNPIYLCPNSLTSQCHSVSIQNRSAGVDWGLCLKFANIWCLTGYKARCELTPFGMYTNHNNGWLTENLHESEQTQYGSCFGHTGHSNFWDDDSDSFRSMPSYGGNPHYNTKSAKQSISKNSYPARASKHRLSLTIIAHTNSTRQDDSINDMKTCVKCDSVAGFFPLSLSFILCD